MIKPVKKYRFKGIIPFFYGKNMSSGLKKKRDYWKLLSICETMAERVVIFCRII